MKKTDAYIETEKSLLTEMIDKTEQLLSDLVSKNLLLGKYFEKLKPNPEEAELPHLYYNSKHRKVGEPLWPIVSGMKSLIQKISAFLDQIIRPTFDQLTSYSLTNSIEFLKHLQKHQTTEDTLSYTMVPQQECI